ncbi:hypothetical protein DNK49_08230 [Azoarcus communis]|uniref:Uncharacterized protein n=1 Tax=Parazoarcus communis SWub3 = DSM 12120 TaxID=1121029 RepID=A0A323VAB8_9RHOO|nr:hypothetical protein DNK49_08230 [Azoarcus communis] [Parazoarcus communis SWub3 = DSM 12120]
MIDDRYSVVDRAQTSLAAAEWVVDISRLFPDIWKQPGMPGKAEPEAESCIFPQMFTADSQSSA